MNFILAFICITSFITALYMMQDEIALLLKQTFGFCVVGQGFAKKHYTFTRSEALQWVTCYDNATITQRGNFVASKAE
jgi:NO-binding membrane sensor protein with MHYT domain